MTPDNQNSARGLTPDQIKDLHPNRWEEGRPHRPKSVAIMDALEHIDFTMYGDFFRWKRGGDGDNGETLQFELDIYFESLDRASRADAPSGEVVGWLTDKAIRYIGEKYWAGILEGEMVPWFAPSKALLEMTLRAIPASPPPALSEGLTGWRLLNDGEVIEKTDEFYRPATGTWVGAFGGPGGLEGVRYREGNLPTRRRLSPAAPLEGEG